MTSYSYYNTLPSWGTSQFQPLPPPTPQYTPSSSWTGNDYFRAHAGTRDNSVFDYVWYKLRDFVLGTGFGRNQAHRWWKRVYSGLVTLSTILPKEIGAAAGYEAIRIWETHSSIYAAPLNADREREREALVGLAAAEATKLWAYTGRPYDKWGRLEASETAAATASRIFVQTYGYESAYESYNRFPRTSSSSRRNALGRRRAFTPNSTWAGDYRPPTPYNGASIVDTLASPASSFGGNSLNMSGMNAALPNSPWPRNPSAAASPMRSPFLNGANQGYIPPLADDFSNDFDNIDDYDDGYEYGPYGGNLGNSPFAGGFSGSAYDSYGAGIGGLPDSLTQGRNYGLGYGDHTFGPGNSAGFMGGAGNSAGFMGAGNSAGFMGAGNSTGFIGTGAGAYGNPMVNPSNTVYDPILGPGIQGTYYPKFAQMQRFGDSTYGYPGAAVGLPPPPGTYSRSSRRRLRRSSSFL